jgi:hypothetical protein
MRRHALVGLALLVGVGIASVAVVSGQDKAAVGMEKSGPFRQGEPIAFNVRLNEALPKDASLSFRISPVSTDEEVILGTVQPVRGSDSEFRVSGALPESAFPGEWHIKVIYLFLAGSGWTTHTIAPNDLRFQVEGKTYPIPTQADVTIAR